MTDMIAAEPPLAERVVRRAMAQPAFEQLAAAIRHTVGAGGPVLLTGCGTSEHAAMGIAAMLAHTLRTAGHRDPRVASVQAFELPTRLTGDGVVVAVSHEGGTHATNEALRAAATAGATTGLITVSERSPGAGLTDLVITTDEQDQSWCHTVGYLSPLVVGAALVAGMDGDRPDPAKVRALLEAAGNAPETDAMAAELAACDRLLIAGAGVDHVTARELALKVEEGPRQPAVAHQLETVRHGHLAAATERTGMVLVLTDGEDRGAALVDRAASVLRAARAIGMPTAAILAADLGDDLPSALTTAGRSFVPLAGDLPRVVAVLLGAALPLQLLAERLARARGVNPDTIGREDPRQAAAGEA